MNEKEQQELKYLISLTLSASEWRLSEGDERDPLRLEVEQRIATLLGTEPVVVDGREQSVVERGLAKAKAKAEQEERGTRRVTFPDGSMHRASVEDIYQEPYARSPTGYRWAVKEQALPKYAEKYGLKLDDDKAAQVEAMWQQHDAD